MTNAERDQWGRMVATVYERMPERPADAPYAPTILEALAKAGRSLHRIYERQCSEDMTDETTARVEKREASLEKRAGALARELGADLYLQTDPRGGTVYLIFPGDIPEGQTVSSCYNRGVFVA